jgi:hypothetical protein
MKKFIQYFSVVVITVLTFTACETTELDLTVSPNDLAANQGDPNLILNAIQLAYVSNMDAISDIGADVTRIDYMFGLDYFNNFQGNTFDAIWSRTYSSGFNTTGSGVQVGIASNVLGLEVIDAETDVDYSFHIGLGKVMQAHMYFLLADYLGRAAVSQALNPAEFPAPILDDGAVVYDAAFALLDEAEALLSTGPATQGATDMFYGGNTDNWIKVINSIRLRSYLNTGNVAAFNSIINTGDFIADTADDFQFRYGTSELQPNTRHPDYVDDYTPSGAGIYQSNWTMETMLNTDDPRIRYYFYRQSSTTPGADAPPSGDELSCSLAIPPTHYLDGGYTYCSVPNGYWGRSHGNDEGTPTDGFVRAASGVYPAGGLFDSSAFNADGITEGVGLGKGGGGAGIEPIILASYVDFWRGEMATSVAQKSEFLRAGLTKSIAKVQSFGSLDSSADASFAPSAADVESYIDSTVDEYLNAQSGQTLAQTNFNWRTTPRTQEDIYAEQYFITLYGGATEAFNYYRKTGFPTTVTPNWQANPGAFPRTFLLPQNEVTTNPNLSQKDDLTEQVFWDTNPSSPTFPPAN